MKWTTRMIVEIEHTAPLYEQARDQAEIFRDRIDETAGQDGALVTKTSVSIPLTSPASIPPASPRA